MSLAGFGKFKVKDSAAREGRNPATGETIKIAAAKKLGFTPAKAVKDRLNARMPAGDHINPPADLEPKNKRVVCLAVRRQARSGESSSSDMALCDLPMEDVPLLTRFAKMMTRPEGNTPEEMAAELEAGNDGFFAYAAPVIEARRGRDGEDLISIMINTDINGAPIEHDKAVGLIALLLLGGLDTVVNFLSLMMIYLARHPDLVAELRADPLKLMRGAEEMFRRFPVVAEARMVAHDQVYKGTTLKHGDMIMIPTAMHGLDKAHNSEPLTVALDRRGIAHSTFGGGPLRCAGMHLARMEVIVTLEEWLKRIPEFGIRDGETPIYHSGTVAAVDNVPLVWTVNS